GSILATWQRGGWVGVDLFFVLSGFLVSSLLIKEGLRTGQISLTRFLTRRGFKIYPGFYVLLATSIVLGYLLGEPYTTRQMFGDLTFTQNYLGGRWAHTWSLAVEEHFYLMLPLCFLILARWRGDMVKGFHWIPMIFIVAAIGCLALRIGMGWKVHSYGRYNVHFQTQFRLDALLMGVLLAYVYHCRAELFRSSAKYSRWFALAGVVGLTPAFLFAVDEYFTIQTLGLTLFYVASALLVTAMLHRPLPTSRPVMFLAYIGQHSYSIYLWHLPLIFWGLPALASAIGGASVAANLLFCIVGCPLFGIAAAKAIEFPALRLRDRWFPRTGKAFELSGEPTRSALPIPEAV
ncbi:MAG TPA: acyltransferase, partial [Pirellulales bacterium]|nr:acyltransferase [Pirellulales bacterium]